MRIMICGWQSRIVFACFKVKLINTSILSVKKTISYYAPPLYLTANRNLVKRFLILMNLNCLKGKKFVVFHAVY